MELLREKSFSAEEEALAECLAWLEEELKRIAPSRQVPRMLLVAEEALANIVDYAYPAGWKSRKIMNVGLGFREELFMILIEDEGIPFNPLEGIRADARIPLEERSPGGWGRVFIEKFTVKREYDYRDGKNILRLFFDRAIS